MRGVRVVVGLVLVVLAAAVAPSPAGAQVVRQPAAPAYGPGGTDGVASGVRLTRVGSGVNAVDVFEPTGSQPASAPVTVLLHGYYELFGHYTQQALIDQAVRKGSIVLYPRWQTGPQTPCAASFRDPEPCVQSAAAGIRAGMDYLRADPSRVQPDGLGATFYGLSFGGYLAVALSNRWEALQLPKPLGMLLDEPYDGGWRGVDNPWLPRQLTGLPSTTLFVCQVGAQGYVSKARTANALCNDLFPRLTTIPRERKNVVMLSPDSHGTPALTSYHALCSGNERIGFFPVDAYDHRFCFKQLDALRSCATQGVDCAAAIGDTPEHRYIGTWSDGVPIVGLKIQDTVPIRPTPYPERAPRPPDLAP